MIAISLAEHSRVAGACVADARSSSAASAAVAQHALAYSTKAVVVGLAPGTATSRLAT